MRTPKGQRLFWSCHISYRPSTVDTPVSLRLLSVMLCTPSHGSARLSFRRASGIKGLCCGPVWMWVRPAMGLILYCSRSSLINKLPILLSGVIVRVAALGGADPRPAPRALRQNQRPAARAPKRPQSPSGVTILWSPA